jgi:hypothetical protein
MAGALIRAEGVTLEDLGYGLVHRRDWSKYFGYYILIILNFVANQFSLS